MTRCTSKNRLQEFFPNHWADFDTLLSQVFGPNAPLKAYRSHATPASAWEDDGSYHVELDVPGVAREDIALTFEKGVLQIDVERKQVEQERKGYRDERFYGKTTRRLALPDTIDPESIKAELSDGVLHVSVAKVPEVQPKRIDIS
ncbi:MAG: Hsp20 family protein [Pirellulales bacterium]|nr:Hsp20 family protein [Pirellulales bacterium]